MIKLEQLKNGFETQEIDLSEAFGLDEGSFVITIQEPDYGSFIGVASQLDEKGEVDSYKALIYIQENLASFIIKHTVDGAKTEEVANVISKKVEASNFVVAEIMKYFGKETEEKKTK